MINFYKVGGCVRDELLGLTPSDIDWEVIGASAEDMINMGFIKVGKNFPIFIHPVTKEEYSIGSFKQLNGNSYEFIPNINITIEEAVKRRDFTINALAKDNKGNIVDCVHGVDDLSNKIIRHIDATSFTTDPLRVLRACRFAAKLNFEIAPETLILLKHIVDIGMLNSIPVERIWLETKKALTKGYNSRIYFELLNQIGALKLLFSELYKLTLTPENPVYHPSKNTFKHTMIALSRVQYEEDIVKFAVLCHDIGKGRTKQELLPKHYNHDINGIKVINDFCAKLRVPTKYNIFASTFCKFHMKLAFFGQMNIARKYDIIKSLSDNFKDKTLLQNYMLCFKADWMGEDVIINDLGVLDNILHDMMNIFNIMENITLKNLPEKYQISLANFTGEKFGVLYREYMVRYLLNKIKSYNL